MSDADRGPLRKTLRRPMFLVPAGVVAVLVAAFLAWSATCPCDFTPGAYLFGAESQEPVTDWSFANRVTVCQIQVRAGLLPHAVNLNCMSTSNGQLYLSCSGCDGKRWSGAALNSNRARLRLDGTVYPVTVTRVQDPTELDRAWDARAQKLRALDTPATPPPPPGTSRSDSWWTFRVEWRS